MKTQEEIEQLAEDSSEVQEATYTPQHKITYQHGFIDGYTKCQEDVVDSSKVTRFEVIDDNGRVYTTKDCKVELSYQDDGRTLKVFINSLNK